jgi:DNA polymerase-1
VGNGRIVCASIFAGPEFNFGSGPRLFVDNFGENAGLLDFFKPYLESKEHKKSWHNYGFDRHLFYNHNIDVKGFGGDTMHMARLFDASKGPKEYSLARLT